MFMIQMYLDLLGMEPMTPGEFWAYPPYWLLELVLYIGTAHLIPLAIKLSVKLVAQFLSLFVR